MDPNIENIAEQTEQPLANIPHRPHHFVTKKAVIFGVGFLLVALLSLFGTYYVQQMEKTKLEDRKVPPTVVTQTPTQTPTCTPRPACLDQEPRCLIPETEDMCPSTTLSPNLTICTDEAKICPDGSYVGRTGPNCEFSPCPQ